MAVDPFPFRDVEEVVVLVTTADGDDRVVIRETRTITVGLGKRVHLRPRVIDQGEDVGIPPFGPAFPRFALGKFRATGEDNDAVTHAGESTGEALVVG